jgi:transposase
MGPKQDPKASVKPRYLERFRILNEVKNGRLTKLEAANALHVSDRQILRLLNRLEAEGIEGLINKNTGQAGHHRIPEEDKQRILQIHRELYPDAGPTFFADLLKEKHDFNVSHETLRLWLAEDGQYEINAAKPRHRRRLAKKPC